MISTRHSVNHHRPRPLGWATRTSVGYLMSALLWFSLSALWQRGYAQTFTEEEISNYATAVLAMEDIRRDAYGEIGDLMTIAKEDVTRHDLRCINADGLKQLPRTVRSQVRRFLVNYCNNAKKLVEDTGLTVELFNRITVTHQQDEELAKQIQSEIVRLR